LNIISEEKGTREEQVTYKIEGFWMYKAMGIQKLEYLFKTCFFVTRIESLYSEAGVSCFLL
jgi:hypothetical protein